MKMFLLFLFFFSSNNYAGQATGKIKDILIRDSDGLVYIILKNDAQVSDKPACATNSYWMIKDENSETGKRQLSALLAAQLAGKEITIVGYNTCTRWGDGEDINLVRIRDNS
ncbi:hypothetical protein QSV34_07660 [Porticoccus sp. W117]|uniref:hypothetical protein n=1 Tax=Porticoccus sp. W117 TaxID=3054777 RepID=UPI0025966265|nr:hypothetical protein [Porticoccus sp. W117]MDM3871230.1 hypothetical protein [Porticoccus sp. W117]